MKAWNQWKKTNAVIAEYLYNNQTFNREYEVTVVSMVTMYAASLFMGIIGEYTLALAGVALCFYYPMAAYGATVAAETCKVVYGE